MTQRTSSRRVDGQNTKTFTAEDWLGYRGALLVIDGGLQQFHDPPIRLSGGACVQKSLPSSTLETKRTCRTTAPLAYNAYESTYTHTTSDPTEPRSCGEPRNTHTEGKPPSNSPR